MGRGRAKAKQQKVARDLKYNTQATDLAALQRELGGTPGSRHLDDDTSDIDEYDDSDEYSDRWTPR